MRSKGVIPFVGVIIALALGGGAVYLASQALTDATTTVGRMAVISIGILVGLGTLWFMVNKRNITKNNVLAAAVLVVIGLAIIVFGMTQLAIIA